MHTRVRQRSRLVFLLAVVTAFSFTVISRAQDTWVQQTPVNSPPARVGAPVVYDAAHQKVVLFGGSTLSAATPLYGDTWTWDGTNWTQVATTGPSPRAYFAFAYDELHQQAVLFGGLTSSGRAGDTWLWDGTSWTQAAPVNSPPARSHATMAYDEARQRVVLFGGESVGFTCYSDTWEWDGSNWTLLTPATSPTGECYNAMAYDAARQQVVLDIGETASLTNQTWTWDGTSWTQKSPITNLPRRGQVLQLAYDNLRQQTVEFGGYEYCCTVNWANDTWVWDGFNWAQLLPVNSPPGRTYYGTAYDPAHKQVLVFGGLGVNANGSQIALNDTWTMASSTSQTSVTITVPAGIQFTFDGTTYTGTQTINIAPGTYTLSTASPQTTGLLSRAVWQSWSDAGAVSHSVTVGSSPVSLSGTYDNQNYLTTSASPVAGGSVSPASGFYSSILTVPVSAVANAGYSFADFTGDCSGTGPCAVSMSSPRSVTANFSSTGALVTINVPAGIQFTLAGVPYTGSTSVVLPVGSYPLSTTSPQSTGPLSQEVFVSWSDGGAQSHQLNVGGNTTVTGVFNTQYVLAAFALPANEGTVTPFTPGPFYDQGSVVLIEAQPNPGFEFDFWGGDCSGSTLVCVVRMSQPRQVIGHFGVQQNWVELFPAKNPPPRLNSAMAYDGAHQNVVLFGGIDASSYLSNVFGDTWIWNGGTWARQKPVQSPPPRYGAAMAYDPDSGQVVLFGGQPVSDSTDNGLSDTWIWDANHNTWTQENVPGPPPRLNGVMAYDPISRHLILFGGNTRNAVFADTWSWDGKAWHSLSPAHIPTGRYREGLATDFATQRIVMFAGSGLNGNVIVRLSDTWEWNGSDWIQKFPVQKPPVQNPLMAYNFQSQEVLLYGADPSGTIAETWAWDGANWFQKIPVFSPSARAGSAMVLDGARQQVMLFGGQENATSRVLADTWEWLTPNVSLVPQMPTVTAVGGNYVVTMSLANQGNVPATGVILGSATLGTATSNSNGFLSVVSPGSSGTFTAKFKASNVPGFVATVTFSGSYNANGVVGIPWSGSFLVFLP